jgi:hypothetical protein
MVREDEDVVTFSTQLSWGNKSPAPTPAAPTTTFTEVEVPVTVAHTRPTLSVLLESANEQVDDDDEVEDPEGWDNQLETVRQRLMGEHGMDKADATYWLIDLNSELDGSEDPDELADAVRLMDESRELQHWGYGHSVNKWRAALSYLSYFGAGTNDHDLRYNLVGVADNWDDWATNHADERIQGGEGPSSGLESYYEFDYEQYANDLRDDYTIVDMVDGGAEVLIFSY